MKIYRKSIETYFRYFREPKWEMIKVTKKNSALFGVNSKWLLKKSKS